MMRNRVYIASIATHSADIRVHGEAASSRASASPQMWMVVVKLPGSDASILIAIGMTLLPWYSGIAL